jgi:DNA excision repair protein ERCC-5
MGVTGLWPILAPTARPTPLPTLNRKRLAVDASIWIYQFLKAVRDKEGNALRNSHVVGFFRRICKLLYFGIKPVFVFDGGAPVLKRQTVLGRKNRREGRREDAARTAGRLLAVQMKKRGEDEELKRRLDRERERNGGRAPREEEEEILPPEEEMVYVGEVGMSAQERATNRKFHKKDAYHLPDIPDLADMGQPNDPRIMSAEQLEDYARQFHNGEDVNMYDFSKIDFNGEFFMSLPAGDRYNILNAARLRSRLRMGLSKEQLEDMFPDRMAFSRFQIERVRERNELTQRLMNLNGMNDNDFAGVGGGRIAGETGREYVLVKNDGVEGGWALGVVSTDKSVGERNKPIDVDALTQKAKEPQEEESEEEFEDVPVEGLNRLPKLKGNDGRNLTYEEFQERQIAEHRGKVYSSGIRQSADGESSGISRNPLEEPGLFVEDSQMPTFVDNNNNSNEEEELNRAIAMSLAQDHEPADELDEEEHLSRAIALSLQTNHRHESDHEEEEFDFEDVPMPEYEQKAVEAAKPLTGTGGSMIAHIVNNRANAAVPKRTVTSIDDDSDSDMDLQSVLAKARKQKAPEKKQPAPVVQNIKNPFDGPLPFERLDFGKSLFAKKDKSPVVEERASQDTPVTDDGVEEDELAGGFDRSTIEEDAPRPLPPWMAGGGDIRSQMQKQQISDLETNAADRERALEEERAFRRNNGPIEIESDHEDDESDVEILDAPPVKEAPAHYAYAVELSDTPSVESVNVETTRGIAEVVRAEPSAVDVAEATSLSTEMRKSPTPSAAEDDTPIEWSGSEDEDDVISKSNPASLAEADLEIPMDASIRVRSPPLFLPDTSPQKQISPPPNFNRIQFTAEEQAEIDAEFDEFSDPEDEELLAQLAIEAEEHARFASTLNNKSERENQEAYEKELKALRSQQKKDRRDADEVSHVMITECQALLRLFGLPYITAPMEAEAQCAELVKLGLVDGIVTDDSDIFLFGGTRVYKNMFNSNKFVECYLASDLEKDLSLSRDQLISIAHLLGSDYTEGLPGVGPVTAVEILSEFPNQNGLLEFKSWWNAVQLSSAPLSKESSTFRKKFRRSQGTKLFLPPGFPSPAVTEAYLKPDVDSTPEPFQWGVPDLDKLRDFLMVTIGWSQERTDEVLVPVIRDMNRRETEGTQANITRYFDGTVGVGANTNTKGKEVGSKRMKDAVSKLRAKKQSQVGKTFGEAAREWASKNDKAAKKIGRGKKRMAVEVEAEEEEEEDAMVEEEGEANDGDVGERDMTLSKTTKAKRQVPAKEKRAKI